MFGSGFGSSTGPVFSTPQSSGPFGMSSVFGGSQPTGGFGASTGTSLFGSTPATPSTGGTIFGNNQGGQLFGSFAQQNRPSFGSTPPFSGAGQPAFGSGSTSISPDGGQGTHSRRFDRVPESTDGPSRDGTKNWMMNIAAMNDFKNCSPEMLRFNDYKNGHKRASGQVQSPVTGSVFGSSTSFGAGGAGGSVFSGGFGAASSFSTGPSIFGQSAQTSSPFGSSFGGTGSPFGQQPTSKFGFGSTGGSIFGSGGGFGSQQTGNSIFGGQQGGGSIFGTQQSSGPFASGFGQISSSTPSIFGQSSGPAPFGSASSGVFGGSAFGGGGGFGSQVSGGFAFSGTGNTGGSLFSSQSSGPSVFGQSALPANPFGSFGNAGQGIFGNTQQPMTQQPNIFGAQQPNTSIFAVSQPQGIQRPPEQLQAGYFTAPRPFAVDPSTKPNWMPEYGLVIPDPSEYFNIGSLSSESRKVNTYDYMRRERDRQMAPRFVNVPLKFTLDDSSHKAGNRNIELGWDSFVLSKPSKKSLADEIRESIAQYSASNEPQSQPEPSAPPHTFMLGTPAEVSPTVQALAAEEAARQTEKDDELTQDQILDLLPKISKEDYYISPSLDKLRSMLTRKGKDCLQNVFGVVIGRRGYGEINFSGPINLEGLDICQALKIKRGRVQAGLLGGQFKKVPATITMYRVLNKDRKIITDADLQAEVARFQQQTIQMNANFQSYDREGTWVFNVFSLFDSLVKCLSSRSKE